MTDEQIVKALECCKIGNCDDCPFYGVKEDFEVELPEEALDLINRKKAENERLLQKLQSEAIKEFAERLKNKIWYSDLCNLERTITPEIITNLVKEMTEVQK